MNTNNPNTGNRKGLPNRKSIRLKGYDYSQAGLYFITICCKDRALLFGAVINGEMVLNDAGKIANACWLAIPKHFPNSILHEYVIMPDHIHGIIELTSVGAEYFPPDHPRVSPDHVRTAVGAEYFPPDHARVPPDHVRVPPDHVRVPPDHARVPPDHVRVPPDHVHVPPDHVHVPPDHLHVPPDHLRVPPDHVRVPPDHSRAPPDHSRVPPDHARVPPDHVRVPPDHVHVPPDHARVPPDHTWADTWANTPRADTRANTPRADTRANTQRAENFPPLRKTIGSIIRGFKIGVTKWMRQNTGTTDVWQRNYYEHIIRNEKSHQIISNYIANNPAKWDRAAVGAEYFPPDHARAAVGAEYFPPDFPPLPDPVRA